jgi:hypothetical protein
MLQGIVKKQLMDLPFNAASASLVNKLRQHMVLSTRLLALSTMHNS